MKIRKRKLNANLIVSILFATIAMITIFAPYQQDSTLGNESLRSILHALVYISSFIIIILSLKLIKRKEIKINAVLAALAIIIFTTFNLFHSYTNTSIGITTIILWILFCLLSNDIKYRSFIIFKYIWTITCAIGIICFFSYILNMSLPYEKLPYYFSLEEKEIFMKYIDYKISFLFEQDNSLRLCGICNEPGLLGTFCALLLCADKINLKKKANIIIFIAGTLSFSIAFFLILLTYIITKLIISFKNEKNSWRKIGYCFGVTAITISYLLILPNITTGNHNIDHTLQRLTISSETGELSGDNRTTKEFNYLFNSIMSSKPLFGMGKGYVNDNTTEGNSSYKIYLIEYGIIGSILIWGLLLSAALYKNTRKPYVIIYVIAFFASIYQRPNIITLSYLLLLMGGIEYIKSMYNIYKGKNETFRKNI